MDHEIAVLAESMGIKGKEFNIIYAFHIKGENKQAIEYVQNLTECDLQTATKIVKELMRDMPIPTTQDIARVNAYEAQKRNVPKCPTCQSTNVQKIGTIERTASVVGLGLFSKKINKSFKCNNCKYTW